MRHIITRGNARRHRWLLMLGALVVLAGAGSCSDDGPEVAGRLAVDGRAEVGAPGENIIDVTDSRSIRVGQRIRVREGTAVLTLDGDRILEMRAGSRVEIVKSPTEERPAVASLLAGDLLVVSGPQPLSVVVGTTDVKVRGAARLSRGLSLTVGTYEGSTEVSSAGRTVPVPALRQMAVPAAGLLPVRPSPIEYSASDIWDQRYLGEAIELGNELLARSQGFSAQVPPGTADFEFFRKVLPALAEQAGLRPEMLSASRAPGETLVGAAIALVGNLDNFELRWQQIFAFRGEGAPWGLVALEQDVSRAPLLAELDAAIERGPAIFGVPLPGGQPGGTPTTPGGGTRPGGSVTTPPTTPGTGTPTTPTTTPPSTTPLPEGPGPLNTGVPPLDSTVNSLVEALSGLLRALGL